MINIRFAKKKKKEAAKRMKRFHSDYEGTQFYNMHR